MTRTTSFLLTLAGAAALGWAAVRTPAPLPADAPATEFSATRAMADIRAIASTTRATGTPEIAAARSASPGARRRFPCRRGPPRA